jgi:hypothetical protein
MPSRSDTRGDLTYEVVGAIWRLRASTPFAEGSTLAALAESCGRDEEETLAALVTAA